MPAKLYSKRGTLTLLAILLANFWCLNYFGSPRAKVPTTTRGGFRGLICIGQYRSYWSCSEPTLTICTWVKKTHGVLSIDNILFCLQASHLRLHISELLLGMGCMFCFAGHH